MPRRRNWWQIVQHQALDAASSTLNYITPKVIKNKLRAFTNWLYDNVGPSDIDAVLNDTKDYIRSTYHGLKEFNFDDDLLEKTTHP